LFGRLLRTMPREPSVDPGPERAAEQHERRDLLLQALNELREDDRVVLYLRHFVDLPEAEIADVIGKRPGTVKSRLNRAHGRLRELIERRYPDLRPSNVAPESGGSDG
jgi:RNA polymerase sigma factor (sigma-70 family)